MRMFVGAGLLAALLVGLASATGARRSEEWVREKAREVKASDTDAWRRIPWVASLVQAKRAAAAERRPVFLFTHEGNIDTGRC